MWNKSEMQKGVKTIHWGHKANKANNDNRLLSQSV